MTDVRNMRKLMESVEEWQQINEVSDFDGIHLDELVEQFIEVCEELQIMDNPVKRKELTQVILARTNDRFSDMGDDDFDDDFDDPSDWDDMSDNMRQLARQGR